jgi:phosphoribosyl 1,2-cyclic phosphate phosphodiesterase
MEILFLGTGTSQGVPMVASKGLRFNRDNPKNWRTRSGLHVIMGSQAIQVDASQEFRTQCIREEIEWIDYFILTHGHADHLLGMDDLRRFCDKHGGVALPVYGSEEGLARIQQVFPYAIGDRPVSVGYPAFRLGLMPKCLELEGGSIRSTYLPHGNVDVLGLVFQEKASGRKVAYYTDCKRVPEEAMELAKGADIVILDGLRPDPHPTHMSISEAVEAALQIGAPQTYLTHMTQHIDYDETSATLPKGIFLAYDGLRLSL